MVDFPQRDLTFCEMAEASLALPGLHSQFGRRAAIRTPRDAQSSSAS